MSVLTVDDLRKRSDIDPSTGCWHWKGAKAPTGHPRIWTLDYDRLDKRVMSGPMAVWNISQEQGTKGWLIFRRCGCADCVNPVHLGRATSRAQIGRHMRLSGSMLGRTDREKSLEAIRKGWAARGITPTSPEIVRAIKSADTAITGRALAKLHGVSEQVVSRIRRGTSHRDVV